MLPGRIIRICWIALAIVLLCWCSTGRNGAAIDRASLTNFDRRATGQKKSLTDDQRAATEKLKQVAPGTAVDFEPVLGSPKWVHARGGFLTGENGIGQAVAPDTAKRFDQDPNRALKSFLEEQRRLFRHGPEVLDGAVKKRDYTSQQGLRTVAWEQQVDGIPVLDSILVAHTTSKDELISVSSQFIPEPDRAADRGTPNRLAKARKPDLGAESALRIAAENLGENISEFVTLTDKPQAKTFRQTFKLNPLPGDASASLVWLPLDGDTLRLCWDVELNRREFSERFRLIVDAQSGEIMIRRKLTMEVSEVLYRVYTSDSPSPWSPTLAIPTNTQPPYVPRSLLAISNLNSTASPLGWINDGVVETRGNNVDAHLDRDGDDRADLPRAQATLTTNGVRSFDFPIDFTKNPSEYTAASTVQLFYWCNFMHDRLYELGFDEASGNFQKDNFGRGGEDSDPMMADAQDGSGVNNANYTQAREGQPGRIQMFVFDTPVPNRDGDLDAEVICHEYAHGLSDRLVGGGVGIVNLQSWGMAEGWSDFYAEALLAEPDDDLGGNYAMGGYVTYQFAGLAQNYYYGIRRYPYTTNMNVDPLTFKDIDPFAASSHPGIPRSPIITSSGSEVHRQGEVWCSMLWDMRAFLLTKYAPTNALEYTNANNRVLRYVTLGLRFAPPNPNFVQARDAILMAVRALSGGSDTNEVWRAFARRGLGLSAGCPDSSTTFFVTEAYDTPQQPEFDVQPRDAISFLGPVGGPFTSNSVVTTLFNNSKANLNWAAGSFTAPWLQLSVSNGILAPGASVDVVASLTSQAEFLPAFLYQGTVNFTNLTRPQVITRVASLAVQSGNVGADPLVITPMDPFVFQGPVNGPFRPLRKTYQLANIGDVPLSWKASTTNNWLRVTPGGGTLGASPSIANVELTLTTNANSLPNGFYPGAVTFLDLNSGFQTNVSVALHVGRDYLTEDFSRKALDLQFSTMTFAPDYSSNFYSVCREPATEFPIDPAGGTPLILLDDQFVQVTLTNGQQMSIFGISSNVIYIGANGFVSFDPGLPTNYIPALDYFFTYSRAAPLYADLNPERGGTISYRQLNDRFVITWEDVPEYGTTNRNNAQLELWTNGVIRMTWLHVQIDDPLDPNYYIGLSRGAGLPADFVSSDLSSYDSCSVSAVVLLPLRAKEGEPQVGTILLGAPTTNQLLVTLSLSDTNEVTLPETVVTVPAGQGSAQFEIDPVDDHLADGTHPVTVTASFPDRLSASATILIDDAQRGRFTTLIPEEGREGDVLFGSGLILMESNVVRSLTISLSASDPGRVLLPSSVVIPPGGRSASFDLAFPDNVLIQDTAPVQIRFSVPNWGAVVNTIYVTDNENRMLVLTAPSQVTEGNATLLAAGRISLAGIPQSNVVVALHSENSSVIAVPATVTNAAGSTNVSFNITLFDNAVTNAFDAVKIWASAPGFISATTSVAIVDDERPFEPKSPIPADLATHVRRNATLSWSANNNAPPATTYRVYFGTNADPAINSDIVTAEQSLTLPYELDPDTTYYWQVRAELAPFPPITSPIWQFRTAELGYSFDPIASPQFVDERFPVSVRARDEYGLVVTNHSGSVKLSNSAPIGSRSSIVITELDVTGIKFAEFVNVSTRNINIAGWRIILYDSAKWPEPSVVYTVPSPSISPPGDVFVLRSLPSLFFPGTYPNFASGTNVTWSESAGNNPMAVLIVDSVGNVVDFVCASGADPSLIVNPMPITAEQWSGPALSTAPQGLSYQRFGRSDSNNSDDWRYLARSTRTNNVGLVRPFADIRSAAFIATPFTTFISGVCTGSVTMLEPGLSVAFGLADAQGRGAVANPIDVFAHNDLLLSPSSPESGLVAEPIPYQFSISNSGPLAATAVKLTNTISTNAVFTSANASQGGCVVSNNIVLCDFGTVSGGSVVTATITAVASQRGTVTNLATLSRGEADGYESNNTVTVLTTIGFPQVAIFESTLNEGDAAVGMTFQVQLSAAASRTTSVAFATSDGTATAGTDYQSQAGVLTFAPGVTNLSILVLAYDDGINESNETFFVSLSNPINLDVTRQVATGTIVDNDPLPQISVADATVVEPDSGSTNAVFNVRLNSASGRTISVAYSTAPGIALPGLDYVETYGVLVFPIGVTNHSVSVSVLGDRTTEPTKTFVFTLSDPRNTFFARSQAVGTIIDNDIAPISGFTFGPIIQTNHAGLNMPVTITAHDGTGGIATGFNDSIAVFASTVPQTVTIGTNTGTWALPLGASFHDSRLQSIYLANEIGSAGTIVGLSLNVITPPAQVLSNFTIRVRHTTKDRYFANEWESVGWVTNCQRDILIASSGWVYFPFSAPFIYNGRENVMVDFSFDNSSFSADGLVSSSGTATLRSLSLRTDSAYGRPLDWPLDGVSTKPAGALTARVPGIQLLKGGTVGVRSISTNSFINGVWSGSVILTNGGDNVVLRAVDNAGHFGESAPFAAITLKLVAERGTNAVVLKFATVGGKHYVVEASSNPTGPWTTLSPVLVGDGTPLEFIDAPAATPQFYRLGLLP